jgi:hypothetical protein
MDISTFTVLSVNAASALSLGLSVTVLADVIPGAPWVERYPWLVSGILMSLWLPMALSGSSDIRRATLTVISLYLCVLFILHAVRGPWVRTHIRKERKSDDAR